MAVASRPWQRVATLGADISTFGVATFAALLLGTAQVFIVPRRLTIAIYGEYRLFLVYVAYLGVSHLGLVDGAFVRWAGRPLGVIAHEWRRVTRWLIATQLVLLSVALLAVALSPASVRPFIIGIAACALAVDLATLAGYALQAAGDFRGASRITVVAPGLFLLAILLLPSGLLSIGIVIAAYVASWLAAALVGLARLAVTTEGVGPAPLAPTDRIEYRSLVRVGIPVLGAAVAAGLSQFGDRILVSASVPVTTFAMYGFASSVMVGASAIINVLSRVSLSHAARHEGRGRAALLGDIYDVLGVTFGVALLGIPPFEQAVARLVPAYVPALPIVRALVAGSLFWAAIHVVLVGTLQTYGLVRKQFALELCGMTLVGTACAAALATGAPLWSVAASASSAAALTWGLGVVYVRRHVPDARHHANLRFLAIGGAQIMALALASVTFSDWRARSLAYAALALGPTLVAARAARRHWSRLPSTASHVSA